MTDGGTVEASEGVVTQSDEAAARQDLSPDTSLGRYRILEPLGRGGMGVVYRAHDEVLDRTVALKVLHAESDRRALRLRREAQAMAQLSHPNIVQVYEVGEARGHWFIAMELVDGPTLRQWQRGEHGWRERVTVYLQAGEGLAAAHAAGLVHRDFKPDNCIIDRAGRARVLDFGLVRELASSLDDEPIEAYGSADAGSSGVRLTRTGTVLGTVAYMSLEQLGGKVADALSDQFSFCVALYEALYGERPFAGQTMGRLTLSLMNAEIQPAPKGTRVPERVRRVVLRGLSNAPGERWPSMGSLLAELRRVARPPRVALPITTLGAAVVAGSAWLLWPHAEAPQPCRDARAQLAGVWDEERRRAVEAAILETELPYAADAWDRVARRLDDHAAAWVDAHTHACEATTVLGEQAPEIMDLRMRCLQRRRTELREAVGVLAAAGPAVVQQAVELVWSLPEPSRCDDVEALQAELPPPTDPVVAAEVEELRQQLALVRSLYTANEHERALTELAAVVDRAEALDYAPLLAEALEIRGALRASLGRYAEAEADLERAYLLAVEHGDDERAAWVVSRLTYVVGHLRAEHERGLWWSRTGLARHERVRHEPAALANLLSMTGTVLSDRGEHDEALEHYERGLAAWKEVGGHPLEEGAVLSNIGSVLTELGELDRALEYYRRGQQTWEQAHGPRHPSVAAALNNIGSVLADQGKQAEALVSYRRCLESWEQTYGPQHPYVGTVLANIGSALHAQGENDQALEHLRRALAIWEQALGPQHPQVGQLLTNVGNVLHAKGELEPALEHLRRSLAILEESLGPDHPDLGLVLDGIGTTLRQLGRNDEAAPSYRRALAIWEAAFGPRHPKLAMAHVGLAELALLRNDDVTAREHAGRAVELRESGEVAPVQLAEARFVLARALWPARDQRARARQLAEQAFATYAAEGVVYQDEAAKVEAWLRAYPGGGG